MSNTELTEQIVAFACQCGHAGNPEAAARSRGWIDAQRRPTEDGRALIEALMRRESRYGAYRMVG